MEPSTFLPPTLSLPGQEHWADLLHLRTTSARNNASQVLIDYGPMHPVVARGIVGDIESFALPFATAGTEQAGDPRETVLGRADDSDVLVAFENVLVGGSGRRVAQLFRVGLGSDGPSKEQRKRLFQNAVWWLMKCGCSNLDVTLAPELPVGIVEPNQPFENSVVVHQSGGCEAISVTLSTTLPDSAQFIGAFSESSLWVRNGNVVTFVIGRMTRGQEERVGVLVQTSQPGWVTNSWSLSSLNETSGALENNKMECAIEIAGADFLRLGVEGRGNRSFRFSISGPQDGIWLLESSEDLIHWNVLSTHFLVDGRTVLVQEISDRQRFYRARLK